MIGGLLGLLIAFAIGYVIVRLCFTAPTTLPQTLSLSFGLGVGVSSCIWFFALISGSLQILFWFDAGVLIVLSALLIFAGRNSRKLIFPEERDVPSKSLRMAFMGTLVLTLLWLAAFSIFNPHGDWDAWAIWNMRARFLERSTEEWRMAFDESLRWSHPDYPLLIPGAVARLWEYASQETQVAPAIISATFLFSTVGVLYGSLSSLTTRSQGLIAVLFLLGAPHFLKAGAAQQADIPLGFFMLASMAVFALHDSMDTTHGLRLVYLAGRLASLAAWTKNEGLLILPALLLGRYPFVTRKRGWKAFISESLMFLIGAAPVLGALICFRNNMAPSSELLMSEGLDVAFSKVTDLSRYGIILISYAREIALLGMPIPLLMYGIIAGRKYGGSSPAYGMILTLFCIVLGHCTVYLITPYDLEWHIGTSLNRLLLQIWPSAVLVTFLILNPPEQFLVPNEQSPRRITETLNGS